uniref:Uncharacterized protein n=1 Tax=Arundo donax TaxID=35708 RepID=A0A0A8Z019_ARUDO
MQFRTHTWQHHYPVSSLLFHTSIKFVSICDRNINELMSSLASVFQW